jgi:hypothetical protein
MSELHFNAYDVEPATEFMPLPNGQYVAVIGESDRKKTKSGSGEYLELVFVVLEGEYTNRKVWTRLNIVNRNPVAQQIANGHLSCICRAVGVMRPVDSAELHNIPLKITVTCKPRGDGNGLTNDISHFGPVDGATDPAASAPVAANVVASAPAAVTQAGTGPGTAPWDGGAPVAPQGPVSAQPVAAGEAW